MNRPAPPSPSDIELLAAPQQPRELRFWADIRLGGYMPGPDFVVPQWNSGAQYAPPDPNDSNIPAREPLPPVRTATVLHDPVWAAAQKNVKLKGPYRDNWFAVKKLGDGGFGSISIWEFRPQRSFQDPADDVGSQKIVVKNGDVESLLDLSLADPASLVAADFGEEARMMWTLKTARSRHIVQIMWPSSTNNPTFPIGGGGNNVGNNSENDKVPEIYMEYCEGGDLEMEIWKRYEEKRPFLEGEIWWLAECLVKALSVLDSGFEDGRERTGWVPIVHFDMKPSNILRSDYDGEKMLRIYKLADFGNSRFMPRGPVPLKQKIELRRKATRGFYTPEQFTERWNYKGWESNEISGEYSTKTNIYGLGLILWCAVTLLRHPIPGQGYISKLAGEKRGFTYGKTIEKTPNFTSKLKQMILTCLFERPDNRPSLSELRKLIAAHSRSSTGGRGAQRFDFVIDLSKETLRREAEERKKAEAERERIQRRNAIEREEKMERERVDRARAEQAKNAAFDYEPEEYEFDFMDTDDEDGGEQEDDEDE